MVTLKRVAATESRRGVTHDVSRGVRRRWAISAAASAAVLAVGGCGVQSTGVNVAQTEPIGASSSSIQQSESPTPYAYTVSLFLFSSINKGPGVMINRPVASVSGPMDLLAQLATLTADEKLDQYTTYVPAGITFKPTSQAHMYIVDSPSKLGGLALQQLTCTFDQWWIGHPDNQHPSTRLIVADTGEDTQWQDCPEGVVLSKPDSAGAAKPTASQSGGKTSTGD